MRLRGILFARSCVFAAIFARHALDGIILRLLYRKNREYEAGIGLAVALAILLAIMFWRGGP